MMSQQASAPSSRGCLFSACEEEIDQVKDFIKSKGLEQELEAQQRREREQDTHRFEEDLNLRFCKVELDQLKDFINSKGLLLQFFLERKEEEKESGRLAAVLPPREVHQQLTIVTQAQEAPLEKQLNDITLEELFEAHSFWEKTQTPLKTKVAFLVRKVLQPQETPLKTRQAAFKKAAFLRGYIDSMGDNHKVVLEDFIDRLLESEEAQQPQQEEEEEEAQQEEKEEEEEEEESS
jgi:hypothetical protein